MSEVVVKTKSGVSAQEVSDALWETVGIGVPADQIRIAPGETIAFVNFSSASLTEMLARNMAERFPEWHIEEKLPAKVYRHKWRVESVTLSLPDGKR